MAEPLSPQRLRQLALQATAALIMDVLDAAGSPPPLHRILAGHGVRAHDHIRAAGDELHALAGELLRRAESVRSGRGDVDPLPLPLTARTELQRVASGGLAARHASEGGFPGWYDREGRPIRVPEAERLLGNDVYRRIAFSEVTTREGRRDVSTVWIGLDHRFGDAGPPLIFETMVFDPAAARPTAALDTRRYATEAEARAGHAEIVAALQRGGSHG